MNIKILPSFLLVIFLFVIKLQGQTFNLPGPEVYQYNLESFTKAKISNLDLSKQQNPNHLEHPEFNIIPFNFNQNIEVVEILEKRTATSREFIDVQNPSQFYIQQFLFPAHVFKNGFWQTLDHRLTKSTDFIYVSENHYDLKSINLLKGFTTIGDADQTIKFNKWTLQLVKDGQIMKELNANWSNYSIGEEGAYIFNIFSGVDAEIQFNLNGSVTTNFIINAWKFGDIDYLYFEDNMSLPAKTHWNHPNNELTISDLIAYNNNEPLLKIDQAIAYPLNIDSKEETIPLNFMLNDNKLSVIVESAYILKHIDQGHKVIIDPVVTGTNTLAQASILGSMYNALCNFNNYCDYDVTVNFPANATITGTFVDFSYQASGSCWLMDGAMRFLTGTCLSPAQTNYFWFCNNIGGGTCNGTNLDIFDHISNCLPPPSCSSQDITFTLQFFRTCEGVSGCDNSCIGAFSPFSVTVIGNTIEFDDALTSNITASATTICIGESIEVSTEGMYGVPSYNYNWSFQSDGSNPIATTNTANITFSTLGNHYLYVLISDQCNVVIKDSILITVTPLIVPTFNIPSIICFNDDVPLPTTSNNGITGTWSPNIINSGSLGTTTYTFQPDASFNCTDIYTIDILVIPTPSIDLGPDIVLCFGETVILNPQINNMDIIWSTGATSSTISVSTTGTYYVTASTASGCFTSDTIHVEILDKIQSTEQYLVCRESLPFIWYGQSINTEGSAIASQIFTSYTGCDSTVYLDLTISPLAPEVKVYERGCLSHTFEGITYYQSTTLHDTLSSQIGCDSIYRTVYIIVEDNKAGIITELEEHCDPYTYNGITYYQDTLLTIEKYTNTVGCDSLIIKKDIKIQNFNLKLDADYKEIYEGELLKLVTTATEDYIITQWEPSYLFPHQFLFHQSIYPTETESYTVYGQSSYGCLDTAQVVVEVKPLDKTLFLPNAFSPNGDGLNDYFNPFLNITSGYSIADFSIYNRLGQRVFTNEGKLSHGWDGTYKGLPQAVGVYYYTISIKFIDGDILERAGEIHLIR